MESIINYVKLSDRISTSGQPEREKFKLIAENGFDTVIFLALFENSPVPDEKEIVENFNMKFVHIPVVFKEPKVEDFDKFLIAMEKHRDEKIYIHCELNWRVSTFMALYRIVLENWQKDKAFEDLYGVWEPNEIWQGFIEEILFLKSGEKNE